MRTRHRLLIATIVSVVLCIVLGMLPSFLASLIGALIVTITHIVVFCFFLKVELPRTKFTGLFFAALAAASWGSWTMAAWEEFQAQAYLPIINIAGLVSLPATIILCVVLGSRGYWPQERKL
ncbi:MAG: hypothetical protein SPJ78_05985 [Corynebacterium camporealensis]|uniref:hypothetical protein n=1 Tax=Corynebacterium camporealensis TaxID=161896 RepID=UPI002A91A553|nr:hypothetical protein [Corynebacterium camporealensis]MDY5840251.1 hypothetical protein [Corynebacterium camporealensis]